MLLGEEELTIYEYLAFLSAYPEIYPEANSEPQQNEVSFFAVSLRNWLISDGLEPVLSHMEKIMSASYFYEYKNVQL